MCGRYYIDIESEAYQKICKRIKEIDASFDLFSFQTGEVFPGNKCLVLKEDNDRIVPAVMKWTLPLGKYKTINIRFEEAHKKFYIKDLKHCVIIASGFFEWDKDKNKYYFSNGKIMYLAGIYDDNDNFAILTKKAEGDVKKIHDREPVILEKVKDFLVKS